MPLRPKRSASAPPSMLPAKPDTENIENNSPASVMPTPNRWVTYSAKKGLRIVRPTPSTNDAPTSIQNRLGYSW